MSKHTEENSHKSFSYREELIKLPDPLRIGEFSKPLKESIWDCLYKFIIENTSSEEDNNISITFLLSPLIQDYRKFTDFEIIEFINRDHGRLYRYICNLIRFNRDEQNYDVPYNEILDLLEIFINSHPKKLAVDINKIFKNHQAAYGLIEFEKTKRWNFFPVTSDENFEAMKICIKKIEMGKYLESINHLNKANIAFRNNEFKNVVIESNSAVEAIARKITGESTLGKSIKKLPNYDVSPRILSIFDKLSVYSNQFRHGKEKTVNDPIIDQDEALLFFGLCASTAGYLTSKDNDKSQ